MLSLRILIFPLLCLGRASADVPVQLVIDTDLGFDVDDVGAISVALHAQDIGLAEIKGIVHNTGFVKGIGGVDVIANYYNSSRLTLGAYTGAWGSSEDAQGAQDRYTTMIEGRYPSQVQNYNQVMSAVDAYTQIMKDADDGSLVIASIGELTNLRDILNAQPTLFERKVKAIYYMDGGYNFGCGDSDGSGWSPWLGSTEDCDGAAQAVIDAVPRSIKQVFSLNGADIYTGSRFNEGCVGSGPVKDAYQTWTNHGSRPSWDPILVVYAIWGDAALWSQANAQTTTVDYYGREDYDYSKTDSNMFQVWIDGDRKSDVTKVIDDYLCATPCLGDEVGACSGYELNSMTNCYGERDGRPAHGARDLETPAESSAGVMTLASCMKLCDETSECDAVTVSDAGSGLVECYRKASIDIGECDFYYPIDTWTRK